MKSVLIIIFSLFVFNGSAQHISVLFDFDKSFLDSRAKSLLDSLLAIPSFSSHEFILEGHTDSVGSLEYNELLSRQRVNAVSDYLTSHGISSTLIIRSDAFGKTRPLNNNITESDRHLNRRVNIIWQPSSSTPPAPVNNQTLTEVITDSTIKEGSDIILRNLNFYGGRHILLPEARPVLEELLAVMKANPGLVISIHGHICCLFGSGDGLDIDTNTPNLSVNRAKAVYDYLIDNGIDAARLSYKGFGHSKPLVYPEDTEEKRTTNRRVEIRIIKK